MEYGVRGMMCGMWCEGSDVWNVVGVSGAMEYGVGEWGNV